MKAQEAGQQCASGLVQFRHSAVRRLQGSGMTAQDAGINNPSYLTAHTEFTKSLPHCFLELSTLC